MVKVLELMPYGYVNSFFYAMASYGKAEYFCLRGENTMQDNVAPQFLDIYIYSKARGNLPKSLWMKLKPYGIHRIEVVVILVVQLHQSDAQL